MSQFLLINGCLIAALVLGGAVAEFKSAVTARRLSIYRVRAKS